MQRPAGIPAETLTVCSFSPLVIGVMNATHERWGKSLSYRFFQSPCYRGYECNWIKFHYEPPEDLAFQSPCYRGYECNPDRGEILADVALSFSPLVIGVMNATFTTVPAGMSRGAFSPLVIGVMMQPVGNESRSQAQVGLSVPLLSGL